MARHGQKTLAGRTKMLSGGDTGDRLAEVNEVLGCSVVQTVEHHEADEVDATDALPAPHWPAPCQSPTSTPTLSRASQNAAV